MLWVHKLICNCVGVSKEHTVIKKQRVHFVMGCVRDWLGQWSCLQPPGFHTTLQKSTHGTRQSPLLSRPLLMILPHARILTTTAVLDHMKYSSTGPCSILEPLANDFLTIARVPLCFALVRLRKLSMLWLWATLVCDEGRARLLMHTLEACCNREQC